MLTYALPYFATHCFCAHQQLRKTNLSTPFKECQVRGSISLYDYKTKKWLFSDTADAEKPTLPASTFKLLISLSR